MNIVIASYSYTGNNDILAECLAKDLSAKHVRIEVQKPMTTWTTILDMTFSRTPKVQPDPDSLRKYDLILFCAPVWLGCVASPLRKYLSYLKSNPQPYGFVSISGGADGENPKLYGELMKRTGTKPVIVLDQHIKDLISSSSEVTRKDTSERKISEAEAKQLSLTALNEINKLSMHG